MSKATTSRYAPVTDRLAKLWPNCFTTHHGTGRKPLARGIRESILAITDEFPVTLLAFILRLYTNHPTYLRSVTVGAARVDLSGNPVDAVTAKQAEHARGTLARQERKRARRLAEREQRRLELYGASNIPDESDNPKGNQHTSGSRQNGDKQIARFTKDTAQIACAERAERKAGKLLSEMAEKGERQRPGDSRPNRDSNSVLPSTLGDLGMYGTQSSARKAAEAAFTSVARRGTRASISPPTPSPASSTSRTGDGFSQLRQAARARREATAAK